MPAHEWTSPAQRDFLLSKLPAYLVARSNGKKVSMSRFWIVLNTEYFTLFSEEGRLGLPTRVPGARPLTAEESELLGKGTNKTKERLKGWMRYRDSRPQVGRAAKKSGRSFFTMLEKTVKKRPYRTIETYQKMYPQKIQDALNARGYRELNEEFETGRAAIASYVVTTTGVGVPADAGVPGVPAGVTVRVMTEVEIEAEEQRLEDETVARIRKNRGLRLSMRRGTSVELFDAEPEEVKQLVREETVRLNKERLSGDSEDDGERTPEQYQNAIDQIGTVVGQMCAAIEDATGWVTFVACGGPMPRRAGDISIKTASWGKTPLGADFQASYPEFDQFKTQFGTFVKRVYSHDVRDARALPVPGTQEDNGIALDGLIRLDGMAGEQDGDSVSIPEPATAPAPAPKRVRRKAPAKAPAASASASRNDAPAAAAGPAPPPPSVSTVAAPALAIAPQSPAAGSGPALHLPDDFDEVMGNLDFDDDSVSSTFGFSGGFASDEEDTTMPFPRAFAPNFSSSLEMPLGEGMDDARDDADAPMASIQEPSTSRPAARPIHRGAIFEQDRVLGGSPGREGSFMPANDYRPSVLFQAFGKPLPPSRSSPLPPLWSAPLARGNDSSPSGSVVRDCGAAFSAFAANARRPPPSSLPSSDASSSPPLSLPPWESTSFSFPSVNASSAALLNPFSSLPAPPSTPFAFPSSNTDSSSLFPTPGPIALQPSAAPPQAAGFSNSVPGVATQRTQPSALSVFKTTVASATAEVEHERTASTASRYVPQYIESRPPANIPKGHPLAPATQKAAEKQAEKDAKAAQPAPAPARRGRPRKQVPGDENVAADAVRLEEPAPAPATMSAAARAESARINREAAALRKQSAALRRLEKVRDDKAAAEEKAAERLHASRENPAGGAPLFVTGGRPKRAINAGKNADGTPILRPKKRGADVMAEEDARIEAAFAAQKADEAAAAGKKGAAKKGTGAAKKTAAATAPRAGARAGTRAAAAAVTAVTAAKPAAKKRRT
ncbi:hypothetical protein DFH06DRAFT_1330100 [Mycena polygramma]|nr:hypothetical protein DFH06DRAFT_1330100 [Mycena polygramma]